MRGEFFVAAVALPHLYPHDHRNQPQYEHERASEAQHPDELHLALGAGVGDSLACLVVALIDRRLLSLSSFDPLRVQVDRELAVSTTRKDRIWMSRWRHVCATLRTDDRRQMHGLDMLSCVDQVTVLLFQKAFHAGLQSGAITLTYRRWPTARVKAGGRYRCHPIGVLEVDGISRVKVEDITADEAVRAGFETREALVAYLAGGPAGRLQGDTELFRVELHYVGDGDRVPLALEAELSAADVQTLEKKLAKLDAAEPWTLDTLRVIEQHPQVAARILAQKLGRDRDPFKVDVRKLKRLGLTQSFEIGYELSPRGKAFLQALGHRSRAD